MTAARVSADTCPLCGFDHEQLDEFWACPEPGIDGRPHGHRLRLLKHQGDLDVYACPVTRCKHQRTAPRPPRSPSKGDPMTTVQTRPSVAIDAMWGAKQRFAAMLEPLGLDVNLFIASAAGALYNNADLMACGEQNPASLLIALTDCARLGHLPGSKDYYLTPRGLKGSKSGPQVLGIEGYEGVVERYYRSGEVAKVVVREVCAKDYFRYVEGEDEKPIHRFASSSGTTGADFFGPEGHVDRGPMVGVYCAVQSVDGHWYRPAVLSRDDVYAARAAGGWTAADTHSPWNRFDAGKEQPGFQGRSMWWKTAAKRDEPWVPTSAVDKRQHIRALQAQALPGGVSGDLLALPANRIGEATPLPANGRQALPQRGQDPETARAAINAHLERLEVPDGQCGWTVYQLAGAVDGEELDGDDLAMILSKLESCETAEQLRDITGAAS